MSKEPGTGFEADPRVDDLPILRVQDLKTVFRTSEGIAHAVDGVSFHIRAGESYALVGESGCGKSVTALSIIQLIEKPSGSLAAGTILYRGQDIVHIPEMEKRKLRGNEISMIFQEPMTSLNPVLTVGDQVMEVIRRHQGLSRREARERSVEMLDLVRIPEPRQRFREYPHQLSGGMKQRVMIAIALACRPGLLIADEPTTALDVTIQEQILTLIRELREQFSTAVLLITHDLGVVAENADRVGVMYAGRIVEEGSLEQVLRSPAHPYTVRLLESLPSSRKRSQALQTIEGRVPPATRFPAGCRFAERCHRVLPVCRETDPTLIQIQGGHRVACVLYDGKIAKQETPPAESTLKPLPQTRPAPRAESGPLLSVQGLKIWFPIKRGVLKKTVGHVRAVDEVDLHIQQGTTVGLVGESGCGKTTLGKGILRLIRPTGGTVKVNGTDLEKLPRSGMKPFRRRLQIVFQDPFSSLDPRMMVGDILKEGMSTHRIGRNRRERTDRAGELMERVGLDPRMVHRYPHEFSGGQRQRIAIARCLAVDPEFIVCDEATSALDVSVQAQIINLLKRLQREMGLTFLFITHDLSVVEYMADEVAVMYLGRIVERGRTEELFQNPNHPYSLALLSSVPLVDPATGVKKIRLEGDVPSPARPPTGCHFHPRCSHAMPKCSTLYPGAFRMSDTHITCCWLYEQG